MKKSYRDIAVFVNAARSWLEKHPGQGKFRYAVTKVLKQADRCVTEFTELGEDFDVEHCSVDKDQNMLKDERGMPVYTKEGFRKRNAARRALFESEVEIAEYLSSHVPADLTEQERDAFAGFVIAEQVDEEPQDDAEKREKVSA